MEQSQCTKLKYVKWLFSLIVT